MYRVAAYSSAGAVKKSNQDSCFVEVAQTPYGDTAIMAVCDGVGGLSSGEVASASVTRWFSSWFEHDYPSLLDTFAQDVATLFDHVQQDWAKGIEALNETLRLYGRNTDQRMGSTVSVILFYGGCFIIGHVGDCRVYQVHEGALTQITQDQTWVAREVARGTITPEQARSHPRRNVILQSVGTQEEIHPVFVRGKEAGVGASYFVCCDGFRNELFDDEIAWGFDSSQFFSEQDMYNSMEALANLVIQRGERDNITAVCLCLTEGEEYGDPLVYFEDGVATLVQPEEEAPPTGYLEENDSSAENALNQDPSNPSLGTAPSNDIQANTLQAGE